MARARLLALVVLFALPACGDEREASATESLEGAPAVPPFRVAADAQALAFTFASAEGPVTVTTLAEVPPAARAHVRVTSLTAPPDAQGDDVYVADLRAPGSDGSFAVRSVARAAFEAYVEEQAKPAADAAGEVVLYGASWCGACGQAREHLRARGVDFVDRDIEREPGAREEMQRKAAAAGVSARAIPVIDFRGTILTGFARERLDRLIDG